MREALVVVKIFGRNIDRCEIFADVGFLHNLRNPCRLLRPRYHLDRIAREDALLYKVAAEGAQATEVLVYRAGAELWPRGAAGFLWFEKRNLVATKKLRSQEFPTESLADVWKILGQVSVQSERKILPEDIVINFHSPRRIPLDILYVVYVFSYHERTAAGMLFRRNVLKDVDEKVPETLY